MENYSQPYIGMQFVRTAPVGSSGRVVFEIARKMPDVDRQTKSIYMSWAGRTPVIGRSPIKGITKIASNYFDLAGVDDSPLNPDQLGEAIRWIEQQDTVAAGALRWLPQSKDDLYRHAAWLVASISPFGGDIEEALCTELRAVCLAEAITQRSGHQQHEWVNQIVDSIAEDTSSWDYGLIEIGDWSEIGEGGAYRTTGNLMRWRQMLEYNVWQAHGMLPSKFKVWREKYPVKGVYWGNYFGPSILDRIGGAGRLKAHIDEQCKEDPRNGWYRDMPGGALFLALSDRISDAQYELGGDPPMRAMANAVWLWSVLREANVMI
jgi:hypothetical protein